MSREFDVEHMYNLYKDHEENQGFEAMKKKKRFSDDMRGIPSPVTGVSGLEDLRLFTGTTDRVIVKLDKERPEIKLLLHSIELKPGEIVIDFGSQAGIIGTALAATHQENKLIILDSNLENIGIANHNIEANILANAEVIPSIGLEGLAAQHIFPSVIVYAPLRFLNAEVVMEQIKISKAVMKKGGRLYLVAHKQGGAEKYIATATEIYGDGTTEIIEKGGGGFRIVRSEKKEENIQTDFTPQFKTTEFEVLGERFQVETLPSLFSQEGLDNGTRLLLENVNLRNYKRMMDLGCGWGAIGIVASRINEQGQTTMADIDLRATYSAEHNVKNLGLTSRINVIATDDINTVPGKFDLVVSNPPFHEDFPTLVKIFNGTRNVLEKGGEIYIVVGNKYLEKFRDVLLKTFGKAQPVISNEKYTVLRSYK